MTDTERRISVGNGEFRIDGRVKQLYGGAVNYWRLEQHAKAKTWTQAGWEAHRATILKGSVTSVFAAGRRALGRPELDRDAIWEKARATHALDTGSGETPA